MQRRSIDLNIILAGPMCVGKTTVGKVVASTLGRRFWDTDRLIEEQTGMPIVRIFSERSETYFRSLEREIVQAIVKESGLVVAAGGGMVIPEENFSDLTKCGIMICLRASLETLAVRIKNGCCRPLLAGDSIKAKLTSILEERRSSYDRIGLQLPTDGLTVEETADRIIEMYRRQVLDV